jgi:hypothetical protein
MRAAVTLLACSVCLSVGAPAPASTSPPAPRVFARNLVVAWFPSYPSRELDVRWRRLQRAVAAFAPPQ